MSNEAIAALQILGYNRKEIDEVINKIDISSMSTEEIIRASLKFLGK